MGSRSVQVSFFAFGTAVLLPWNCILSAMAFMDIVAFPGHSWTLLVSPLYNLLALVTQGLLLFAGEFVAAWKLMTFALPLGAACCLLVMLCVSSLMPSEAAGFCGALAGCLSLGVLLGGILQSSTAELSAQLMSEHGPLPAHFSNGLAAAGVISFVAATGATAIASQALAVKMLFLVSAAVLASCVLPLVYFLRTGTIPMRKEVQGESHTPSTPSTVSAESMSPTPPLVLNIKEACEVSLPATEAQSAFLRSESPSASQRSWSPPHSPRRVTSGSSSPSLQRARSSVQRVSSGVARAWRQEVNICAIYIQTFFVFPAVSLKWVPENGFMAPETYGLLMVSDFQVFDLVGRLVCTWPQLVRRFPSGDKIWLYILVRTLLLPLFFMCWWHPIPIFQTCALQSALVGLLGLSNGILTNLVFVNGASGAVLAERDIVGRAMSLFLSVGIVTGSLLSSATIAICNTVQRDQELVYNLNLNVTISV